jgi:hypothetical protein
MGVKHAVEAHYGVVSFQLEASRACHDELSDLPSQSAKPLARLLS